MDNKEFKGMVAAFRWNKNGIITDLELHAGVCMGVSDEDIETIIDLIKLDFILILCYTYLVRR